MPRFDTITLTRPLKASQDRVFQAFADPAARAIWGPPTPELNMSFTEAEFRVGGRDLCICGPGPAEGVEVETLYHAITAPALIHFTEVIRMGDQVEGASLVTVVLSAAAGGTQLDVTIQTAGLGDTDTPAEVKEGWTAALENLTAWLSQN